jgi:cobalt-zinc-cadmium resistance protein CzcA
MSLEAIREITVSTPDGSQVPLGTDRRHPDRRGPGDDLPRGRGALLAGEVQRARARPGEHHRRGAGGDRAEIPRCDKAPAGWTKLCRPYDTRLEWAGEINELHEAEGRLQIIIPLTMLLITFLTYSAVKNWVDTILVIINIPIACTGGVLALLVTGTTSRCPRRWASSRSSASPSRTRSSS